MLGQRYDYLITVSKLSDYLDILYFIMKLHAKSNEPFKHNRKAFFLHFLKLL